MKLIVSLIAWLLVPLAVIVIAFQVAKAYVEGLSRREYRDWETDRKSVV